MSDRDPANTKQKLLDVIEKAPEGLLRELLDYAQSRAATRQRPGPDLALVSEAVLAKDCLSPEEDEAWADL